MPFNGSGSYSAPGASFPAVASTLIESTKYNAVVNDMATALSTAICKDGQTTVTANIPLAGFKLTGVGAATARTDAASLANIQDGTGVYVATVGGTADVITITPSPAITAYAAGQTFRFLASGANTTNVTVNANALGAKAITKNGATALVAGDIPSGAMVEITYDGTRFILGTTGAAELTPTVPYVDTSAIVVGSADATKKVRLEVDGLTTGTTRVVTVPDKDGTLAMTSDITAAAGRLLSETYYGIATSTVTLSIASPCVVALASGQAVTSGMPIVFTTTIALPSGVVAGTTYYCTNYAGGNFNISATPNGTAINTTGSQSGTHTANNPTYNKTTNNPATVSIEMVGGGGGGGGCTAVAGAAAAGGGGGGYAYAMVAADSIISGSVTLTVGSGGAAGDVTGTAGTTGGDTTAVIFTGSKSLTATGGVGGSGATAASTARTGGAGGQATIPTALEGRFFTATGSPGFNSVSTAAAASSASGPGGATRYGSGARNVVGATNAGLSAQADGEFNAGGGGSGGMGATAQNGGVGAPGLIIIREYS